MSIQSANAQNFVPGEQIHENPEGNTSSSHRRELFLKAHKESQDPESKAYKEFWSLVVRKVQNKEEKPT